MDDDKYINELVSLAMNAKIKKHTFKETISYEQLLDEIVKNTGFTKEKVRTISDLYFGELAKIKQQNPEAFKKFMKERYNAVEVIDEA